MPVPESSSSYSRRYGREDSYSSYARSTSTSGIGRSSYLSSYSKASSTLPPRPPSYEIRKYTGDTSTTLGSRFLSSSASRARDYGSSASNYRSSVSPVRASVSSIRRQLESTAPTIAERIRSMELGEDDPATGGSPTAASRLSRYSSAIRSRDSPLAGSRYASSAYSRDRSGSKDYGNSSPLYGSREESRKSSAENLLARNRERNDRTSPPISSGSRRNGHHQSEVNSSESSATSDDKGVSVATTTNTTTPKSIVINSPSDSVNLKEEEENKCAKRDVENNDSDSSSSVSAGSDDKKKLTNGFGNYKKSGSSTKIKDDNLNSSTEEKVKVPVTPAPLTPSVSNDKLSKEPILRVRNSKSVATVYNGVGVTTAKADPVGVTTPSVTRVTPAVDNDSNGNPISTDSVITTPVVISKPTTTTITTPSSSTKVDLMVKGSALNKKPIATTLTTLASNPMGSNKSSATTSIGSRFLKKSQESDSNANILPVVDPSSVTCNGEVKKEKSPTATLNYTPPKSLISTSISPSASSKKISKPASTPAPPAPAPTKVIYHTIQVEKEKEKEVSPEPVSFTVVARKSLDGTGPIYEVKSTPTAPSTNNNTETVTADFKVTLPTKPKPPPTTTTTTTPTMAPVESGHNNKCEEEDASNQNVKLSRNKTTPPREIVVENLSSSSKGMSRKSPELLGTATNYRRTSIVDVKRSPTPEKTLKSRHSSKDRETTPTPTPIRGIKAKSPSPKLAELAPAAPPPPPPLPSLPPPTENGNSKEPRKSSLTNGEAHVNNINEPSDSMGPHSSKYIHGTTSPTLSHSRGENRNETRSRFGGHATTASDSSDNDSDGFSLSPNLGGGKFRSSGNSGKDSGYEKAGLTGLRNIGNTCFMNTVLQCLSNTKPLLEYVMKDNYEADINRSTSGMKGALIRAFGELIHELWRDQRVVDTSAFKDQIQRFAPRFMGYSQQDAQEFLRYLLEGLHEDVNRVTAKPTPIHTDIDDSLSDNEKAAESWKRYLRYESSKIVDMFVGQFKSTLRCTVCGHCSVTFDPFWDLSLPIPSRSSNVKLSQCFELLAKEEVLDGDEKPTCAKCQCRRKCTKSLAIQKFPKILVVHLKRFSLAERYRGKLSTLIDYPLNGLDLTTCSATRGVSCTYNLYGVANHSGSTYSGHYVASCKHPYTGEWHSYNDSRVSPISSHSVVTSEGYVLFYEQVGHSSLL